jgi:diacylglycerol O-acyltransferase
VAQQHLDRLTAVDASFLHQESGDTHMHVGAVLFFEGEPPTYAELADHIRSRLHLVPRYRQRLAIPPIETGRPLWVDDPTFNLEYHVRHTALPAPGSDEQLLDLVARIHSQALDRAKPLWEIWLVEGLAGDRWAMLSKTHHALVDGISGVDLATVLFDVSPDTTAADDDGLEPWRPHPEPTSAELVAAGVRGAVRSSIGIAARALSAALRPQTSLAVAREAAEGVGEVVWAGLNPAPETPLNVPIGPHRRYRIVRHELGDYKMIKNEFDATVNDVVLTVVSGALARWLRSRGVRTAGLELRGLVPVSTRSPEERGQLGNRLAAMRAPLPVYITDPVARLRFVKQAMDGLKESKQAVGAEVLASVQNLAPPTVLAQASRLNFSTRLFNLIVTNVPGPQFPLYALGRRLRGLYPIAFLPKDHALAVAIMSYDGWFGYGLLADYEALPDLDVFAEGLEDALAELLVAARKHAGAPAAAATTTRRAKPAGPAAEMRAKRRVPKRSTNGLGGGAAKRAPSKPKRD